MRSYRPKKKKSLYVTDEMVGELKRESERLDRSESWCLQYVWERGKSVLTKIPSLEPK